MSKSIWATLSAIDCSAHIEKKGQFSYLAWTWAWAMVKENYPWAEYELLADTVYPDGTMEVRVKVSINTQVAVDSGNHSLVFNTLSHTMWLPVLDFKNKAICNPNAFDINSSRMRCLVKCLAMFGLGHYIYAGESAPNPSPALQEDYERLVELVAKGEGWELRKFTIDQGAKMDELFNMAPQGKKTQFKADVRDLYGKTNGFMKAWVGEVEARIANGDSADSITECYEELTDLEKHYCVDALDEITRHKLSEAIGEKI